MGEMVVDLRRALRVKVDPQLAERPAWKWMAASAAALLLGVALGRWILGSPRSNWHNPLDGATFTRLTDFDGAEEDAVISRDGNFVSFLSARDGRTDVWVLQIASGQFLNLTQGKLDVFGTQIRALGFSPDSSHVTVVTGAAGKVGTAMPTIGGPARVFLDGGLDPQWSPDGKRCSSGWFKTKM